MDMTVDDLNEEKARRQREAKAAGCNFCEEGEEGVIRLMVQFNGLSWLL